MSASLDTQLLARLLDLVKDIRDALRTGMGEAAGQSSVEVATSTRGYDVKVKAYVGSPIEEAGSAAVAEYLRVRQLLETKLMGQS